MANELREPHALVSARPTGSRQIQRMVQIGTGANTTIWRCWNSCAGCAPALTGHGFRSSFSDWAAESTHFPSQTVEMALAHTITNQVEAAYRRGDLIEKRRELMQAWGDYLASQDGTAEAGVLGY
jgi:integrase